MGAITTKVGAVETDVMGKEASNSAQSYLMAAIAEFPIENYNQQGLLYAAKNFDKAKPLEGGTSYSATAPVLQFRHMGGSQDRILVIQELSLWIFNTPGAATQLIVALDTSNRYSSGGQKNTNLYAVHTGKSNPANVEIYEGVNGAAIVATAGEGNQVVHSIHPATAGTKIEVLKKGEVILGAQNNVLLLYAFAATTAPTLLYRVVWAER